MTEVFELGDFQTTTGYTIPGAKLSYKTHGSLSASKDNAILFPHFLGGAPEYVEMWIGEGRPLDPTKYFIVCPGQFGNGTSSSPSNTPPPIDRGAFPPVRFADDVIAQHKLATEQFGITEFQLLLGWSTGALQIYEWASRFPTMVKRLCCIAGAPKPSPWTRLWLRTVLEEPITSDPAWNNGFYSEGRAVQGGLRRMGHGAALTLPPPGFYREGHDVPSTLGFASVDDYVSRVWETYWLSQDPNDLLVQIRKAIAADPSRGGDMDATLRGITARTSVIAFTGDPMFPPADSRHDAERIPNASFREIPSAFGHLATFGFADDDRKAVDAALAELLAA
jgi:homoserine O-acetyltransferase